MESTQQTSAGRDLSNTAGQDAVVHKTGITVAHSVPVRGAANKPTSADRNSDASLCSADPCTALPSHYHAKSGQGSGDGVPGGGEAAVGFTSLDQKQINRNKGLGRGRHCGRFTIRGTDANSGETRFHRVNCKCWKCSYCGPRKAKRYKRAIRATAEAHQLRRFLTLTLDPAKIQGEPVRYLNGLFAKLRVYLKRKYGVSPQYIRVLEFQQNGTPHFHILVDRYIPYAWIRGAWVAIGGGSMVDIRYIDVHRVSRYLSKYLTKDLLMSAPQRSRRVTTSRGIHLFEKKPQETSWTFLRVSIFTLLEMHAKNVVAMSFDEEEVLESFSMIANGI